MRRTGVWPFATGFACAFSGLLAFVAPCAHAAPGDLDTTFDGDGKVVTAFSSTTLSEGGQAVAIQPDAKIVVAGYSRPYSSDDFTVARYTAGGALDPSFGSAGVASFDLFNSSSEDYVTDMALQADGKIVVAGYSDGGSTGFDFAVIRLNSDGTLDTTFSGDGIQLVNFVSSSSDVCESVAIQSNGKIVLAGGSSGTSGNTDFAAARLNSDGSLDTSFSGDGLVTIAIGSQTDYAKAVGVQSDGKIALAGYSTVSGIDQLALVRLTSAGTLDTTFATTGKRNFQVGTVSQQANALAFDSNSKLVVAGYIHNTNDEMMAVRFNTDGTVDSTFYGSGSGYAIPAFTGAAQAKDLVVDSSDRVVLGGYANNHFALTRLNSDGTTDTSFGTSGKTTTIVASGGDSIAALKITGSEIIAAGQAYTGFSYDIAVARYLSTGQLNTLFGTSGVVTSAVTDTADFCNAVMVQTDGKTVAAGSGANSDSALVRYNTDGSLDTSFGSGGKLAIAMHATALDEIWGLAQDGNGKIIAAGYCKGTTNNDFYVIRLNADGSFDTTFGTNGKAIIPVGTNLDWGYCMAVQSDGKIVVGGTAIVSGSSTNFAMIRLTTTGTLDSSFGTGGKVITAVSTGTDEARAIAIDSQGLITLGGFATNTTQDFTLVQYTANGALNTSFGTNGVVTTAFGDMSTIRGLAVDNVGRITATGFSIVGGTNAYMIVTRYTATGALDTSFNTTGKVIDPFPGALSMAYAVKLQGNKTLVVGSRGTSMNGSDPGTFFVARLTSSGQPDTTFGTGGIVTTGIGMHSEAIAMAFAPSNKLVAAGNTSWSSGWDFALARYDVSNPNSDPTISTISNKTFNEDTAGTATNTVGDAETSAGSLTVTATSNNQAVLPNANIGVAISGATRNYTFTPVANATGTATVTLTVSDGDGGSATTSFTVTFNGVNDAPTVNTVANQSLLLTGGDQTINLSGIDEGGGSDEDAQNLAFTITSSDTGVVSSNSYSYTQNAATGTVSLTPQGSGTATVTITLKDDGGTANGGVDTTTRTFTVTVTDPAEAPVVTDFDPPSAAIGDPIEIFGSNFTGATAVMIGATDRAQTFTVINDGQIHVAAIAAGTESGVIKVINVNGTGVSVNEFNLLPEITSFTPTSGVTGNTVTITGTGFKKTSGAANVTAVRFSGPNGTFINATSLNLISKTLLTCVVPGGVVTGHLRIRNDFGSTETTSNFTVTGVAPSISSITPTSGPKGTVITVSGTNFTGVTTANLIEIGGIGNFSAVFRVVDDSKIKVTVPAGVITGKGYQVKLTSPSGTAYSSAFTVSNAPLITSFTPTSGKVGTSVTVTGVNFNTVTAFYFSASPTRGPIPAQFLIINSTTIQAFVPSGAISGPLSAQNPSGKSPNSQDVFVVVPDPESFTPASGPVDTLVTIDGRSFQGVTGVYFNGVSAGAKGTNGQTPATGWALISNTQIQARVPSGATTGPISLRYPMGLTASATTPNAFSATSTNFSVTGPAAPEGSLGAVKPSARVSKAPQTAGRRIAAVPGKRQGS